ncbi:MAG TPA: tetratricopeptide repeat protein [Pyrinomonadaceae bacterium]|nr:tetratricopeptide repeat protein [Pyrinomonadaceae bacterium]
MKRIFTKLNGCLIILLISLTVFGQPNLQQKQIEAKAAFDEAIKLRQENTFKSYKAALEKFEKAARIYEELGDNANFGSALLGAGLMKNLLGENDEALELYLQALEIFRAAGEKGLEARALNNLGSLYDELGDSEKALESHLLALPLRKIVNDKSGEARTLNAIGVIYLDLGERQKALEFLQKSLTIRKGLSERAEQAITLNNIGRVYDDLGEKEKAFEYLSQSLVLRRSVGDKLGEARTLNNLGLTFADSEPQKAVEYFRKAIEIFTASGFENETATILNNIGTAYLDLKEPRKALEFNRQSLTLHQQNGNKSGAATTLNNIGFAHLQLDETIESLSYFNRALILAQETQNKGLEAIILSNLMRGFKKSNNSETAIFYGKQSVNRYQELRSAIKDLDKSIQKTYLKTIEDEYRFLADLLIELGRFAQAEVVLRMLKEEEFSAFVRRDADEIKTLSQRVVLTEKEKLLLERYKKLAENVASIGQTFQKLDDRKRFLSRQGEMLSAEETKEYEKLSADLSDANAVFKLFLEKDLVKEIGNANVRKIEIDRNLQDKLRKWGNGTIALSTIITNDRYRVIVTTPTVQIDGKTDIKLADLNKKIFAFRAALQDRKIDPRPLGKELYDILIKPIEKVLTDAQAKTLIWSLDGTLRYIPLATLSPDGESYLVEKYQNAILTPKTRDNIYDSNAEWKALGMGVSTEQNIFYPDFPNDKITTPALPAVEDELKGIIRETDSEKGILSGKRFLNQDFTLKNLTDSLAKETSDGKKEFTVIHLASHFRLSTNWSDSFLLLGNSQILTLEEMSNSPQISFGDVELVTLSACNTAAGDDTNGGEVDSLAELIQTKSGKSVLATLWAVGDESTSKLMNNFYRLRKENPNMTKAEAVQAAQKILLYGDASATSTVIRSTKPTSTKFEFDKSRPFAHPYFWSPFVLIGNWR